MKSSFLVITLVISITFLSCKENPQEPEPLQPAANYFPTTPGTSYKYSLDLSDSSGNNISGTWKILYSGDSTISGTPYQRQIDSIGFDLSQVTDYSFFRKSQTGVFYYVDTTGFGNLVNLLPDSLKSGLKIDTEARILFNFLDSGQGWPVYKVSVTYGNLGSNLIEATAVVINKESITINLNSQQSAISTYKILYSFKIINSINPLAYNEYQIYGWVSEDIGFVKWEGDAFVLNILFGLQLFDVNSQLNSELFEFSEPVLEITYR